MMYYSNALSANKYVCLSVGIINVELYISIRVYCTSW